MARRVSDPAWKSGPTYQEPTDSEHDIRPEDFGSGGFDFDGFGVDEAEQVEGDPLIVIQESATCSRDGCDATHTRRLLFTTQPLSDAEEHALDIVSGGEPSAYVWDQAERVGPESIQVDETRITAETVVTSGNYESKGSCYGGVEPDPEPQWRDI
jgi:hypothetical protein